MQVLKIIKEKPWYNPGLEYVKICTVFRAHKPISYCIILNLPLFLASINVYDVNYSNSIEYLKYCNYLNELLLNSDLEFESSHYINRLKYKLDGGCSNIDYKYEKESKSLVRIFTY